MNCPLIIPSFNQRGYLINLINWWLWYYPNNPVYILDNNSDDYFRDTLYPLLIRLYRPMVTVVTFDKNDCVDNLRKFLEGSPELEYYVISDPDIMPLPNTPPNFLEIFKHAIDNYGFHHAGFGLKTYDIPEWLEDKATLLHNELSLLTTTTEIEFDGKRYKGFKAPIDTTFALYKKSNGGWKNPQSGEAWNNSLRLFYAYHLPWYLHPSHLNPEMKNYFSTARFRIPGVTSTGVNNYRPEKYKQLPEFIKQPEKSDVKVTEITSRSIINPNLEEGAIYNNEFIGFREDYLVLHCLLRLHRPKTIFEIGTNMGTGTQIIKNACINATVMSLDLPTELAHTSLQHPLSEGKGDKVGSHCKLPFIQVRGDSMQFDYSRYPAEAYFIDGEHDYQHPLHETQQIILQKPKLIIYHDSDIKEVYRAIIDAFAGNDEYLLYRVVDTRILYALRK